MKAVTVRDLRNNSAAVLARVGQGETLTVTKDGTPVAAVTPLPRLPLNAEQLVERFKQLPPIDAAELRRDIDEILDPSL
ncbi:type II toxin-antitoxin system Phd/YefM family antitoxin [Leucobacter soli]|uniref:type II toxin-antitoxin system Phd/YefM family antitoxin n=1 Tax=Leucobacter soli TaxID=2812850 RepID=UPI001F36453F|nr:type II toxin-antitoxin system prevent-host-death family antitoxin [Leucobacter soli]